MMNPRSGKFLRRPVISAEAFFRDAECGGEHAHFGLGLARALREKGLGGNGYLESLAAQGLEQSRGKLRGHDE